ncbi:MAG: hypothetical protein AB7O24_24575 [Kofleriaceae bacterium]
MGRLDDQLVSMITPTLPHPIVVDTHCSTIEELIESSQKYFTLDSCFVPSTQLRAVGFQATFSFRLTDGTPALQGACRLVDIEHDEHNAFDSPGVWLGDLQPAIGCEWVLEELTGCPGAYVRLADGTDQLKIDMTPTDQMPPLTDPGEELASSTREAARTLSYGASPLRREPPARGGEIVVHQASWRAAVNRLVARVRGKLRRFVNHVPPQPEPARTTRPRRHRTKLTPLR